VNATHTVTGPDEEVTVEFEPARLIRFIASREGDDHQARVCAALLIESGCLPPDFQVRDVVHDLRELWDLGVLEPFVEGGLL
jgi:hypothetical protein